MWQKKPAHDRFGGAVQAYDYVIVGAGSAGCVLANRLTEDGSASALLLEAGGRDRHPLIHIPLGLGRMHARGMFDWGYHTEPEPNLNGRRIEAMRGKVLGGSSSINVMAFTRGHPGDYDRWAQKGAIIKPGPGSRLNVALETRSRRHGNCSAHRSELPADRLRQP